MRYKVCYAPATDGDIIGLERKWFNSREEAEKALEDHCRKCPIQNDPSKICESCICEWDVFSEKELKEYGYEFPTEEEPEQPNRQRSS